MTDVVMVYLHSELVSHSFMDSTLRVLDYQARTGGPVPDRSAYRCGPSEIPHMRNMAMSWLVVSGAEWLWMVDTDMGFREDTLEKLLENADPVKAPVVSALCWAQFRGMYDGMGGYETRSDATLYRWERELNGHWNYTLPYRDGKELPPDQMVEVAATGAACMLIHRTVAERISQIEGGPEWFTPIHLGGDRKFGEDISFCHRARLLEIPMFVHTGIPTTHHKLVYLGGDA